MTTAETSIPEPVVETAGVFDSGALKLRIYRCPTALIDSGGYRIYRSSTRTGFAGTLGSDFELLPTTVSQLSATTVYTDQALTGQPTTTSAYYRVRAVDNFLSPSLESRWSNLATWEKLSDRTEPVPTLPSVLRPGMGVLSGIVDSLEDSDDLSGDLTWYEFARVCSVVSQDKVYERLLDRFDESRALSLYRDPPGDLVDWYEALVVLHLLPRSTLPVAEVEDKSRLYEGIATRAMDGLFSSSVVHPPGAPAARILAGQRVR